MIAVNPLYIMQHSVGVQLGRFLRKVGLLLNSQSFCIFLAVEGDCTLQPSQHALESFLRYQLLAILECPTANKPSCIWRVYTALRRLQGVLRAEHLCMAEERKKGRVSYYILYCTV